MGWPQHIESGAFVNPETNAEYLAWLSAGNQPEPADPPAEDPRWTQLKSIRDQKILNGGAKVGDKWFHSDTHSKVQQLSLLLAGENLPAGIQWKTMDGTFIEMTPTLAQQIYQAQMAQEAAIFNICELKKLDDSPVDQGWPEVYVEVVE
jgi:hypothetical protein